MSDLVARAKAALKGVTRGPWATYGNGTHEVYSTNPRFEDTECGGYVTHQVYQLADARFIAAARSLVPELVAEVERQRFDADWFTKRLQDELDPGGGDEWDADDVVQIVRDLEAEVERLRASVKRVRDVVDEHATRGIGQRILDALEADR